MNYKRTQVGSKSMYIHSYPNGAEVAISYQTPIAAYIPGLGFIKTREKFSQTTSRHVGVDKKPRLSSSYRGRTPRDRAVGG